MDDRRDPVVDDATNQAPPTQAANLTNEGQSCPAAAAGYEFEDYIKTKVYITESISQVTSVIDKICLVWVTVVLLGGFASNLDNCNFWFLAGLLLLQGVRYLMNMSIVSIAVKGTRELPSAAAATAIEAAAPDVRAAERRSSASIVFADIRLHVKWVMRLASSICYLIRVLSYIFRALVASLAIANMLEPEGQFPLTAGKCGRANFLGELWAALLMYYFIMAVSCIVYFCLIEAYGWWWTSRGMRRTVDAHEAAWTGKRLHMYPWTEGNHRKALRYTYYLYFKAQHESFAAMMTSSTKWDDAPTEEQIVLPWPWVEAVRLCFYCKGAPCLSATADVENEGGTNND